MKAIRHGLAGLLRFSGRDAPGWFWPYVAFVIVMDFAAGAVIMVPSMLDSFRRMQAFAAAHPDQATVERTATSYSIQIHGYHPELMPNLGDMAAGFAVMVVITILFLAAAVSRRLHDRDRRGAWGLMPLPFLAAGLTIMPRLFAGFSGRQPDMGLFGLLFLNNLVYLALLALLIVMLAGRGTEGANRYGPPPPP